MQRRGTDPRLTGAAALILSALAACTSLPTFEPGTCGNGLVEPLADEDCDRSGADCGAPDTAQACHLLCTTAADCPATAVCGRDGACHVPTGTFVAGASLPWTQPAFQLGDVDGDGAPDLLGVGDLTVDYRPGDGAGSFGTAVPLASLPVRGSPVVADITGDGVDDVALSVGLGTHVLSIGTGAPFGPTFQPSAPIGEVGTPMASAAIPFAGPGFPSDALVLVARIPLGPDCSLAAGCDVLVLNDSGTSLGRRLEFLATARLPWTRVASDRFLVALPFVDDPDQAGNQSAVFLQQIDIVGTQPRLGPSTQVTLPVGATVASAVFGRVDGDGRADLVIATHGILPGRVDLAIAPGTATGVAPPVVVSVTVDGDVDVPTPIGAVDVDGDGADELVASDGLWVFSCAGATCVAGRLLRAASPWRDAQVADVDGDGRLDVVAQRQSGATVDLELGTGVVGVWNDASFEVPGQVELFRIGDFDGNGLADIAMAVVGDGGTDDDELMVAFGQPRTAPTAPRSMGRIGSVVTFESVQYPTPSHIDLAEDLFIAFDRDGARAVSVMFGAVGRQMIAPLLPGTPVDTMATIYEYVEVEALAPLEVDDDPAAELVALCSVWGHPAPVVVPPPPPEPTSLLRYELRVLDASARGSLSEATVAILDAPLLDKLDFTRMRWVSVPAVDGAPAQVIGADRGGLVISVPVGGCPGGCSVGEAQTLASPGLNVRNVDVQVLDLDGVGPPELVVARLPAADVDGQIWIWRGGVGTHEEVTIPAPLRPTRVAAIRAADGTTNLVVAALRGDGTVGGDLLIGAPDGAGRYTTLTPLATATDLTPTAVTGVAAADLDGDGADDLVITQGDDALSTRTAKVLLQAHVPGGAGVVAGEGR